MQQVDVAVIGGGLAGSCAAAMLGRAGISVVLIDPHSAYPPDFRCEKLDGSQVAVLGRTGLGPAVLRRTTHDKAAWVARFGHVIDRRPSDQQGILYHDLVNTVRTEIPAETSRIAAKVTGIAAGPERQAITLSTGGTVSARLAVLAHGLNIGFGHALGLRREVLSPCHSITIGFDMAAVGGGPLPFPALSYYTESPAQRMAYITLFPIGNTMRANLMTYRDMRDPWLKRMRETPVEALSEIMPRLARQTGPFTVEGRIHIRPADLYVTRGVEQAGIVLVGDAYATSCPAAGTGTTKVFTDVERLCNVHIPAWLATPGMGADKIAAFYADPVKRAADASSLASAYSLRSLSIDTALPWKARRVARFALRLGIGALRRLKARAPEAMPPSPPRQWTQNA